MTNNRIETFLTPGEAARVLEISVEYVRQLTRSGLLPCIQTRLGRLIDPATIERFRIEREKKIKKTKIA
jgi:excisionase family DNA binding protein